MSVGDMVFVAHITYMTLELSHRHTNYSLERVLKYNALVNTVISTKTLTF
jgi:hypothetical protein